MECEVVLLSGEAGIGKSRLVQMLKDHVAEEPHTRLECRSSPYFTNSALYPIIDMVQRTLRFQSDDTTEAKLEKLELNLRQYRLPVAESVPLFAALLSLPVPEDRYPPLALSPQRQRQKTLEAILDIILELAEREPVLFILEDAHWLDASTNELLDLLIDQTPTASLLMLITYRPEFQPTWGNRSYLTQLTLNRLSRNQVERMAEQVAGDKRLPGQVIEQLVDKTDGVPLYVEEMTKAVLETGVLKEVDGQYELTGSIGSLTIPATLQDSLMGRLDRLVTAKAVAQYASVIGRQFSYELLQAVSQLDEAMLQHELSRLVEAELLYQRGLPPQATYIFKHALIQDTAYESLLRSTRQGYHRQIAEVLAERFPDTAETQPELLAHHYTEAGLNDQAVPYWQQAGQRAIQRSANVEAMNHLTWGLEALKALPDTAERAQDELRLLITLGPALIATKGYTSPEVETVYNRAYQLCHHVGDVTQRFDVLAGLRRFYFNRGEYRTAREIGEQLLALAQQKQEPELLLEAYWSLGGVLFQLGEFALVKQHLHQAAAIYEAQGYRVEPLRHGTVPGIHCLSWLSLALWMRGYADQALQRGEKALTLARQQTSLFALHFVLFQTAILYQYRREWSRVREYVEAVQELEAAQGGIRAIPGHYLQGWVLTMQGQVDRGISLMRQQLVDLSDRGHSAVRPYALALLAEADAKLGRIADGLDALAEGLSQIDTMGAYFYEAEIHRLKGQLLLQQSSGTQTEAEACFYTAISIAQNQNAKSWELRAVTSLARLWQQQGKVSEAHNLLTPVYGWFTEGFDTADLIDAKTLLVELEEGG